MSNKQTTKTNAKDQNSKSDSQKVKPGKYVILKNINHWEIDEEDISFVLSHTRKGAKPYAAFNNLKKAVKDRVMKAVELGVLDFTDDPENYQPPVNAPEGGRKTPRYVWRELNREDVKNNRQIPKAPQFSSGTMEYVDKNSKAFKLLKLQAHQVLERLPGYLSGLDEQRAIEFLREALAIETRGLNPAMGPRRQVVDALNEELVKLGVKRAMLTGVISMEDEDSDPNVKARFAI